MASALINSTISGLDVPVTLSSVFEEVTKYNVQLNIAERLWASWYLWMQNDTLATGILAFVMHEVVYFGRSLPFIIMELIPYFNKYKIQNQKIPTWKERFDCASLVLLSHFTVELPQIWLFHPFATMCGMEFGVPFPPAWKMAMQIAVFFVCEDAWHYWFHRALHYGPLYRNIHKLHHTYSAPFGMAAEYASPIETMLLGIGTVGVPIVWVAITKDLHLATMYVWIVMRLFQAVDAHSGYDFPWSLHNFLPFWAGAHHHDLHHERFIGNYASSFRWWDFVLDTEAGDEASKKRREKKLAAIRAKKAQ
ncbi:C-4 sterol methyl oxidase [Coniochaeta pulveracea]|uniref:C-4 sterol methyl oxidase n=1 Tax=Coniochaeta pulveracea TaxID=177199 RepID=A0A420YDE4_9PEZI|nr:C-4 sterol methyl oxidase [Coniochaeta pulveracea]